MGGLGINGLGRIGRRVLRLMDPETRSRVKVVNDIADGNSLVHLFKYDSVHGRFEGSVEGDGDHLIIDGHRIRLLQERDPFHLGWHDLGVETVIESTGFTRRRESNDSHLNNGARNVIATGLIHKPDITIVCGVNHDIYDPGEHRMISIGAGLTQMVTPAVKVLNDQFDIEEGRITLIQAVSPEQVVMDQPHQELLRGRSALQNIVPHGISYGPASIGSIIPELNGRFSAGLGYRVPILCGSVAEIHLDLRRWADGNDINQALQAAADGPMRGVLFCLDEPRVSSDFIGDPYSCIVDTTRTDVRGERAMIVVWQDNETACARAVLDTLNLVEKAGQA